MEGKKKSRFDLKDRFLYFDNRLCIPRSSVRLKIINDIRGNGLGGHFGRDKTTRQVEIRFFWPQLKKEVAKLVRDDRVS